MFGIGGFELLIILVFGFILVGDRLPDVAKTLGRAIRTFQAAQRDMSKVIKEDVFDPEAEEPFKDPLAALDKMGGIAKKTGSSLAGDFNEMAAVASKKKPEAGKQAAGSLANDVSANSNTTSQANEAAAAHNASAGGGVGAGGGADNGAPVHTHDVPETFAERRARYEKERAARLAAKEQEAKEQAAKAQAAAAPVDAEMVVQEPAQESAPAVQESASAVQESTPATQSTQGGE